MKQSKKCRLCGCIDESGESPTCVFCGEATWQLLQRLDHVPEPAGPAEVVIPVKQPKKGRR